MSLSAVFNPKSIAIVGASTKIGSVGNDIVKNLATQGYRGLIYPVNPKVDEIYGLKCYKDISDVPETVDLVVIAIPASFVPEVIPAAAAKGAKGVVVISAGFKETGNVELEHRLAEECRKHNIALIGPNCLGVINPAIYMNASFSVLMPKAGSVAFMSQSGALCTAILDYAVKLNIGFSKFASVGNKAETDEIALLKYLYTDKETKVVAMYVEDLKESGKFIEAAKKLTKSDNPKPIIILKSGRTSAGASASASHTGSLAGNDAAYDALFRQCGVIRASSVSQMFNLIQTFTSNPMPKGRRVAIVTNAGGPGVLTTDMAISCGLELAKLSPESIIQLKAVLPPSASLANPIDILGDAKADRYAEAIRIIGQDPNVDSVLIILTPQSMTQIEDTARIIIENKNSLHKPLIACFMGETTVVSGIAMMKSSNVTVTAFPEEAAEAMAVLTRFAEYRSEPEDEQFDFSDIHYKEVKKIFAEARTKGIKYFPEAEAAKILKLYNLPVLSFDVVKTSAEALTVAKKHSGKMVMKIVSKDIVHKSDVGGVMLGISPAEAGEKFDEMIRLIKKNCPKAAIDGVLMAEMVDRSKAVELILGQSKDPSLGAMLMVGLGGIYVELFKDVAFGLAPISKTEAYKMLSQIKAHKIIEGLRGQAKLDEDALIEAMGRLSKLVHDFPEIKELDINPLALFPDEQGAKVLDVRIIIE